MKAIFKKEFRSVILSKAGIAFIGLFLCFAGIMTSYWNFSQLSSSFEVIFAYMPFALIALIPVLSIGAYSGERENGTDRFLAILPISTRDTVLGKYFARLLVAMIPNAAMAFIPVILDFSGDVNYATAYAVLLTFSLLEAMLLALCMYVDVFFKNTYLKIGLPYAILVAWFAIGVIGNMMPVSNVVSRFVRSLLINASPFKQFDGFLYGIIDFSALFVYIALTVLFVALTVVAFFDKKGIYAREDLKKILLKKASRTLSLVMVAAVLVASIGVIITPKKLTKIDMTAEKTYTLSPETKDFLDSLDKDVTVYAINFEDSEYRVRLFLDRMASYSKHLSIVDVDTEKDNAIVEKYGLDALDASTLTNFIIVESDVRAQAIYYSSMFTYSNETLGFERISASNFQYYYSMYASSTEYAEYANYMLTDTDMYFEGQTIISQYIEYVSAEYIPAPYILGGHGGGITDSFFEYFCTYYGVNYKTLELAEGESVSGDVASLLIARPETDITESELEAIRAYLERGGQVTVLTNQENLSMPNLMALMASYGMSASDTVLKDTVVIEETDGEEATADGEEATEEETVKLDLVANFDHDMLSSIANDAGSYSFTVQNANPLELSQDKGSSLLLVSLLKTDEDSYLDGEPEAKASYTVAATAELARGDRLVWFTGADSFLGIGENVVADQQQVSNTMLVLLTSEWTNNVYKSVLSIAPASRYTSGGLDMSETAATVLGMMLVAIIPAIAVGTLAAIRYKREKI